MKSDRNNYRAEDIENLAREVGVYLSQDRLDMTRRQKQYEVQQHDETTFDQNQHHKQNANRPAARHVGRPRGSRSSSNNRMPTEAPENEPEAPEQSMYQKQPRFRRFF